MDSTSGCRKGWPARKMLVPSVQAGLRQKGGRGHASPETYFHRPRHNDSSAKMRQGPQQAMLCC